VEFAGRIAIPYAPWLIVMYAAGGDVAYTEFPDTNHNSWDATYRNADNIAWLLEQRRR